MTMVLLVAGTSAKALLKGIDTWKKETIMKRVNFLHLQFLDLSIKILSHKIIKEIILRFYFTFRKQKSS